MSMDKIQSDLQNNNDFVFHDDTLFQAIGKITSGNILLWLVVVVDQNHSISIFCIKGNQRICHFKLSLEQTVKVPIDEADPYPP